MKESPKRDGGGGVGGIDIYIFASFFMKCRRPYVVNVATSCKILQDSAGSNDIHILQLRYTSLSTNARNAKITFCNSRDCAKLILIRSNAVISSRRAVVGSKHACLEKIVEVKVI